MMKNQARILSMVKYNYWSRTHMYGLRVHKPIADTKSIYEENNNTLLMYSRQLDMKNIMVKFK